MTSSTRDRGVIYSGVLLVGASALLGVVVLTSAPMSSASAARHVPGSSTPTMAADMPGMDQGSSGMPTSSPSPTVSSDTNPWTTHDHSGTSSHSHATPAQVAPDRPLGPVLGVFGGGTSAVLLSAVFLRRKDRARSQARRGAHAGQTHQ